MCRWMKKTYLSKLMEHIVACGDISVVECDHLFGLDEVTPDEVELPGIFVDAILA